MDKDDLQINALFSQHDQSVAVYTKALQFKRQYLDEISSNLVQNKLEYASKVYNNLEKSRKKAKSSEFSVSDLMGIEKIELLELDLNQVILDVFSFNSITDQFYEKLLELISTKANIHINFYLLNLINYESRFSARDTYIEELNSAELPRRMTVKGLAMHSLVDDTSVLFKTNAVFSSKKLNDLKRKSLLNFSKLFKDSKINRKQLLADTISSLKACFIPNDLKQEIYLRAIPNHNSIDESFYKYYINVDPRMPKHVENQIDCNVKTMFCIFSFFDTELQEEIFRTLKIFYNYRPDIGYKSGMEIYGLILGISMRSHQLLQVFVSLILDYNLIFGVFKGIDFINENFKDKLFKRLKEVLAKTRHLHLEHFNELVWNFFMYCVSNCFYCFFSLKSLKWGN